MLLKFILITLITVVLLVLPSLALAEPTDNQYNNTVSVTHLPNMFDKFFERVTLFLKFSDNSKLSYNQYLLNKRLAEIHYVIDSKQIDYVEPTASRYQTSVEKISSSTSNSTLKTNKTSLLNFIDNQTKSLTALQNNFKGESGWWLAIQHDINVEQSLKEKVSSL